VSRVDFDEPGADPPPGYRKPQERMHRPAAALRRGARIEQPDAAGPLDERQVRVAEDDRIAPREPPDEPLLPAGGRTRDVHHPDPDLLDLENELLREQLPQRRLVGVPVHRLHRRSDRAQLLQHRHGREVAPVKDQVGPAQRLQTDLGEPSGSPREVRVGDDDYFLRQGCCFVEC
jgi:hypothetical protein